MKRAIITSSILLILAGIGFLIAPVIDSIDFSKPERILSPVTKTERGSWVRMTGSEEKGVNSQVILQPGEKARISWEEGRITYGKFDGHYKSYPVWGAPSYNEKYRDEFRFSNLPGIPAAGVLVILGTAEDPETVLAFPVGQTNLLVENTSNYPKPLTLYYHDMVWDYDGNGADGSISIFKVYKLN